MPSQPTAPASATGDPAAVFTLAQISDPHLGPLPDVRWRDLASKRLFGYVNWHRNRAAALGPRSLRALVADLLESRPDHIAVTGDLINIGLAAEIEAARAWLESLGDPRDVTAVPGNHDAYTPAAVRHYEAAWHAFMAGDGAPVGHVAFPFVRRRGPVGLVGVSSAVPTAPLMATGEVRKPQADRLEEALAALGREGRFRIVLIHHPPAPGSAKWHRRLIGAGHVRRAIHAAGAELVLHGHNHETAVRAIEGPDGPVPVVGATSASIHPHAGMPGGSYLLFRIAAERDGFVCDMTERGARTEGGEIVTLSETRLVGAAAAQPTGTRTHA